MFLNLLNQKIEGKIEEPKLKKKNININYGFNKAIVKQHRMIIAVKTIC